MRSTTSPTCAQRGLREARRGLAARGTASSRRRTSARAVPCSCLCMLASTRSTCGARDAARSSRALPASAFCRVPGAPSITTAPPRPDIAASSALAAARARRLRPTKCGIARKLVASLASSSSSSGSSCADRVQLADHLGGARRPRERIAAAAGRAPDRRAPAVCRRAMPTAVRARASTARASSSSRLAGIRVLGGEQPVRERAERIQIGALIERPPRDRFGRHAGGVPTTMRRRTEAASAPKSSSLQRPSARHAHVARAQVAVQQPARVQQRERRGHVAQVAARFAVVAAARACAGRCPRRSSIV